MPDKANQKVTDCSGNTFTRKVYSIVHHASGVTTGVIKSCASSKASQKVSFIDGVWLVLGRV